MQFYYERVFWFELYTFNVSRGIKNTYFEAVVDLVVNYILGNQSRTRLIVSLCFTLIVNYWPINCLLLMNWGLTGFQSYYVVGSDFIWFNNFM